ncbi:hypothetical protein D3C86_1141890 [compost metagenome]
MLALVLPGKVTLFPDICPAVATAGLLGAALEGIPGAVRVNACRCRFPQESAKIVKVRLRARALLELGRSPASDEVLRGKGMGLLLDGQGGLRSTCASTGWIIPAMECWEQVILYLAGDPIRVGR